MMADIGANRFEDVYNLCRPGSHTIKIVKPMPALPGVALAPRMIGISWKG